MLSVGGGGPVFKPWRKKIGSVSNVRALVKLAQAVRPFPDMDQVVRRLEGAEPGAPASRIKPQVVQDLEEFHRIAVAPYWKAIARRLNADRTARGQIMLGDGVGKLLATLHPAIRWTPPTLEVPGNGEDLKLESAGLALVPSLFLNGRPPVLVGPETDGGAVTLIYPTPVSPEWADSLWETKESTDNALNALVGRTRASVLETLTSSCTTTEVGERVGISSAAASQHTSVLRAAGLITTLRTFNKVQHTITPLGGALLHGDSSGRF
ncbi:winged helix-turn-helix domain-containing protein [Streptomyces sp. MST-110588]|uniref:winged helix-turn-helix domain-containing protein n=1 Tax=Streptomyces sp. MST-110588 TaxID=2833628 RepID=UPI001F5D2AC7|nr:winged helix-turn-helix domain-containing protein [Streptomyces sp. MST-110588]UNO41491.1 winged helix-turn-helix transcriptional regulator [Streptomyces sp. MST-110588]